MVEFALQSRDIANPARRNPHISPDIITFIRIANPTNFIAPPAASRPAITQEKDLENSLKLSPRAVPPYRPATAITPNRTPRNPISRRLMLRMPFTLASSAYLSALVIIPENSVKVRVTTYCPNTANGTARPRAAPTPSADASMLRETANTVAMIPPMMAFGGCAPPIGILPI